MDTVKRLELSMELKRLILCGAAKHHNDCLVGVAVLKWMRTKLRRGEATVAQLCTIYQDTIKALDRLLEVKHANH